MNGQMRELPTLCHLRTDVLPPIKFKQYSSSIRQPHLTQQVDMSGVLVCQAHKQIPGRLRPLNPPTMPQSISDTDGINNNTSEVSFDLQCQDTECDDTLPEHERPKAPEPMILESISNFDLSELMNKEDSQTELMNLTEVHASKIHQVVTTDSNKITHVRRNTSVDCLVVEDIDDVDYSDGAMRSSGMLIVQTLSQEPLIGSDGDSNENYSKHGAKGVSCKSIPSNKGKPKSHSKLRRFTSSITRAVTNKIRKLRRPSREVVPSNGSRSANESDDSIATSTKNLLQTLSS